MSEQNDPPRWNRGAHDAPAGFAALVRADDADAPGAPQLERMLAAVTAQAGVGDGGSASVAPRAASGAGLPKAWLLATGSAALLLAGGASFVLMRAPESAPSVPVSVPAAQAVPAPAVQAAPVAPAAPAVHGQVPAAAAPSAPAAEPERSAQHAAPAARAQPSRSAQPVRVPAVATQDDPVAELTLLERAQRALRSDPAAALALAESHRARFARGSLAQEREMLAIDALLRLGRRPQAERRARAFEQRYPESSHRPRLRDLLTSSP